MGEQRRIFPTLHCLPPPPKETDRQTNWERETERKDEKAEKEEFYAMINVLAATNMTIAVYRTADTWKTKPFSETFLSLDMTTQSLRQNT